MGKISFIIKIDLEQILGIQSLAHSICLMKRPQINCTKVIPIFNLVLFYITIIHCKCSPVLTTSSYKPRFPVFNRLPRNCHVAVQSRFPCTHHVAIQTRLPLVYSPWVPSSSAPPLPPSPAPYSCSSPCTGRWAWTAVDWAVGGWSGEGCVLQVAADAVCSVLVVVVWTLLGGIPALLVPSLPHALSPLPLSSHPHLWKDQDRIS